MGSNQQIRQGQGEKGTLRDRNKKVGNKDKGQCSDKPN